MNILDMDSLNFKIKTALISIFFLCIINQMTMCDLLLMNPTTNITFIKYSM